VFFSVFDVNKGPRIDELVVESLKGVSDVLISTDIQHALEALHDNIAVMRHPDHSGGRSYIATRY
jgi:phospholipase D1/2